jgi:hypothetical protein
MSVPKIMALRMGIYCVLIGYLVGDLFVFRGPIYRALNEPALDREGAIVEAKAEGVVARVYYRPIFRTQIDEAVKEYLWRRGRTPGETSVPERMMIRELVLHELIDEELIKLQIKVTEREVYEVSDDRVTAAVEVEQKRYPTREVFEELAKRGGWQGEEEQKLRVTARIQREDYLGEALRFEVSEEEAMLWSLGNVMRRGSGFVATACAFVRKGRLIFLKMCCLRKIQAVLQGRGVKRGLLPGSSLC